MLKLKSHVHKIDYKKLAQQLSQLENIEEISPELLNGLLNAYQELSVDYYKHNNNVDTLKGLMIAKEMYQVNFEEILAAITGK
ncbi:hypothetical protein [Patiriisocius sp. Uisw_017]|jgi:hypothetical protein|uniref:hypothetical protein n=1 Tax=Patiriisocius sp. Uisw_017 TaxID=3230968 RepID=UPI0039E739D5